MRRRLNAGKAVVAAMRTEILTEEPQKTKTSKPGVFDPALLVEYAQLVVSFAEKTEPAWESDLNPLSPIRPQTPSSFLLEVNHNMLLCSLQLALRSAAALFCDVSWRKFAGI